ncbi:hypothetical protein [Amycolatopsis sp. lyj-84]|uniref:hypothetical protein n=1 Tax=Amycolatopsis sp. lyj-84 TaxID=2789284 RepID=UPI003979452C
MKAENEVQLRWEHRTVRLDDIDGTHTETVIYSGIAVVYHRGGHVADEVWLPVGEEEPTVADDEVLITALRTAWRWTSPAA